MNMLKKRIRQMSAGILVCLLLIPSSFAADEDPAAASAALLAKILDTTTAILAQVQQIPVYIKTITEMAASWIDTKDNDTIANNQFGFASLNKNYADSVPQQVSLSQKFTQELLMSGSTNKTNPALPYNANELAYTVLLGQPIAAIPQAAPGASQQTLDTLIQAYIKNVSGTNLALKQVNPLWRDSDAKKQYQTMYNTVTAIASYNVYILSGLYKQQDQDTLRTSLMDQASNSDWFKQVASETLGLVLRQMLMYTSQIYVQLDRLIKVQQQQLAAQAMTNTLLVIYANFSAAQTLSQQAQMAR